jgi:hypothetical protein
MHQLHYDSLQSPSHKVGANPVTPTATELLLASLRWFAGTGDAETMRQCAARIQDWDAAIELARAHWLEPLLAWQLRSACADMLEPAFAARLHRVVRASTAKHLLLAANLHKLLEIFQAHGIAAVPLKGPLLAAALCDEIPWRDSADLDLLVRRADITRARDALIAAGYRLDSRLPPGEEKAAFHWRSQLVLLRDSAGPAIDLHWQLLPSLYPCARYFDSTWERLRHVEFHGCRVPTLAPEDNLFFLCAHAARHSWHTLRLAADVARLIHVSADLDWDRAIGAARNSDGAAVMALGLWIVNRLLDVRLPAEVLTWVDGSIGARKFATELIGRMLRTTPEQHEHCAELALQLRLAGGWWPRLRCAAGYALLPSDADGALRLPRRLFFLYYLYRPVRLTAKYGARLLGAA